MVRRERKGVGEEEGVKREDRKGEGKKGEGGLFNICYDICIPSCMVCVVPILSRNLLSGRP